MKFCVTKKLTLLHSGQLELLLYKMLKLYVGQISYTHTHTIIIIIIINLTYENTTDIVRFIYFIYKIFDLINS